MKKLLNKIRFNEPFFKFDLKMKLTTLFLFAAFTITHANDLYSQKKTLSLEEKNSDIGKLIEKIETASDFRFVYNVKSVDLDRVITIKANNENIETVLKTIFKNTNTNFKISGTHIILKSKKETTAPETVTQPNKEIVITGKVMNSKGETLPGVTIMEKGTKNAVASGFLGNYQISVKDNKSVLVFSFVGFSTKEVVVGSQSEINLVLAESVQELESVQIVSTGFQKIARTKVTGAADNIDSRYFDNSNKIRLQESLQGSIAGLQVLSNNSHPQSTPQVIIRGVGSAFQDGVNVVGLGAPTSVLGNPAVLTPGSPLYVIDGVSTFDGSDLSSINGNDIKSITVLKDAAAASIYGARAANGVIVVETKSGKKGKAKVNYSSQVGVSDFVSLGKSLNSSQLKELYVEGLINNPTIGISTEAAALAFLAAPGTGLIAYNPNQNTNWTKELTRQSIVTQHNLSISGGDNINQYYLSLGYLKNETGVKTVNFDRFSVRLKYDTKLSDKFKIGTNMGYSKTESDNYETGNSFYNPFRNIYRIRPDFKIYKDDGTYDVSYNSAVNPLGILTDETRNLITNDFRGAIDLVYEVIPHLTFENYISGDYKLTENYNKFPKYLGKGFNNSGISFGIQQNTNIFDWNARSLLRYDLKIGGSHHISTFAGIENNAIDTKISNVSVNNLRDGSETLDNGITVNTYTKRNESAISSVFLNSDYDFQNKYLLNASFRRDGSSKFGSTKRYGNFYAAGLGWNIHNEDFMSKVNFINVLKLRASYGINGNDQIGDFNYTDTYDGTASYNGENVITFSSAGNSSLGWEENATFNVGVDFSVFNNRLSGYFDYYSRNTSKLLYNLPTSALNGDNFIFQNFGGMKNNGFEITLNTKNIVSQEDGFNWSTGITFTSNTNTITELKIDNSVSGNYIRNVGDDFNTLYLYGYAGVDPQTGSELFYTDQTKAATTTDITKAVKYSQGKTTPDFYGSFTNTFSFKKFTLSAQFYSSWGGQVFETGGYLQNDNGNAGLRDYSNTSTYVYENRWQKPGDITNVPKYVYLNTASSTTSTRWLHDASYVRLKKVELSYDFSNKLLDNMFITKLRLYTGADNLWTYIKDKTLQNDPEIGGITGSASFDAPLSTTVYFGLNVTF